MSDTPYGKILKSLADLAKLPDDENYRVSRNFVMREVVTIRESADLLERENAALRHDIERHVKIASDLATELEGVRKDAERWRYRINCEYETSCSSTAISREEWIASRTAAIDAAIAQGKGEK